MRFSTTIPLFLLSLGTALVAAAPQPAGELEDRTFNHICPSGTSWKWTKCCPNDAYEQNWQCKCNDPNKSLSADGRRCESKCSQSGWKWCQTQCCPEGAYEEHGQCKCSDGKQLVGSGSNKKCVDQCQSGHKWCKSRCCPDGASENNHGQCVCDNPNQQLSKDGKRCENKCPANWNWCSSQCCPPGSKEEHGQCKCTDPKQTIIGSGNDRKCGYNCPSGTEFKSTKCCPKDAFELHGECKCNDSSKKLSSDGTKCESSCPNPGEKYTNGVCCKSYLQGKNGKCVCPTEGHIDNGSSCSACPAGQNYNWVRKQCDPACPQGTSYKITRGGKGVCCRSGHKACETVCCPVDQEEVGHSGKCCKPGSTLDNHGKCLEPSYAPNPYKKRGAGVKARGFVDTQLALAAGYFGLDANADGDLCPGSLAACPIDAADESTYECLDTQSDLQSCGGCASLGQGVDCTAIKGAKWMGCVKGQCEVYSCAKGFKLVDNTCRRV